MSQSTGPSKPSENVESVSVTEKSAMLSPGTRGVPGATKIRSPTSQSGRSSTHGDSISNSTEDAASSSNKSQSNFARRAPGKLSDSPIPHKRPTSSLPAGSTLRPENQYTMKKKRFLALKKELTDKQKVAQNLYNEMTQLREKLITSGAKDPGKLEPLKLEVGTPKPLASVEATGHAEAVEAHFEKLPVGKELLESLEGRLREVPSKSMKLCQELLNKQSDFVAFVTTHLINASDEGNETDHGNAELTVQLELHQRDYNNLKSRLNEIGELEENTVTEIKGNVQSLVDEYENSRMKIREMNAAQAQRELQSQLDATLDELQKEKEAGNQNKERLRQAETHLQKTRTKIKEMETSMATDKEKLQQLQASIKTMEGQMKQKDLAVEARLKDMQKTLKNSEDLITKVEKQRDSFEARLVELKEKMTCKENESMSTIKELSERLTAVTTEVGVEREKRQQVEEAFAELEERYKSLEEKSQQLCELAEKNKEITITEGSHTENEMRLFVELQDAKQELEKQREVISKLQQEKEEIIAVMHQAANREEDDDSRKNLAAELAYKSNELQNMMMKHAELKKVAKNAQEKNGILERQLIEIQERLHSQSMEGGRAGLNAHVIKLQQNVSDLRNSLAEVNQQKQELETALTQKQLELEQRDYVMREQGKVLKVRDELLEMLKGKVQQENGELSNNDENNEYLEQIHKQITAKTEAIQGLYTTLETKQMQIMRLEKMVKMMEDQQDRAQAQRTRFENRIAQLELALQRNKEQRGKGFGIL